MPTATVTVRQVKNKDSGVDLTVPTHKENPGLFQTIVEYHVVCVSSLACFKSPKHKESDTVQFMVPKKQEDFEKLKKDLEAKFSGTVFPAVPKSMFGITIAESSATDRRHALEHFIKFIAYTPKLATCHITLEFLGINPITAGKFSSVQHVASTVPAFPVIDQSKDIFEESRGGNSSDKSTPFLFSGDNPESDDDELFKPSTKTSTQPADDIFQPQTSAQATKLFDDQDFGDAITADEENLFLVPGAKDSSTEPKFDVEDNSELFRIEDDLEDVLKINQPTEKPPPPTKKPAVAAKPRPKQKQAETSLFGDEDNNDDDLFKTPSARPVKPAVARKPKPNLPPKPGKSAGGHGESIPKRIAGEPSTVKTDIDVNSKEILDTDDILKYIESNEARDDTVDLFS